MKALFNFYLEDDLKLSVQEKLTRLNGARNKGQLAALLRVLLMQFNATSDAKVDPLLLAAIEAEYETSAKLNKRSRL